MTPLDLLAGTLAGLASALLVPTGSSRDGGSWRAPPATAEDAGVDAGADQDAPAGGSGSRVMRGFAALAAAGGGYLLFDGTTGVLVGLAAAAGSWRVLAGLEPPSVRRRRERLEAGLPHVVDLMAAALTAGLSPSAAVQRVAQAVPEPMAGELMAVDAKLRLGMDPASVWRDLARHPQLGRLGRALTRAVESGASVAEALHRLADDLRVAQRAELEARARAVGVKAAVPLGVCLLPAFVLVGVVPLVAGSLALFTGP